MIAATRNGFFHKCRTRRDSFSDNEFIALNIDDHELVLLESHHHFLRTTNKDLINISIVYDARNLLQSRRGKPTLDSI